MLALKADVGLVLTAAFSVVWSYMALSRTWRGQQHRPTCCDDGRLYHGIEVRRAPAIAPPLAPPLAPALRPSLGPALLTRSPNLEQPLPNLEPTELPPFDPLEGVSRTRSKSAPEMGSGVWVALHSL